MTEATTKAALVKAKGDAEAWFIKMSAAVKDAEDIMAQKMASEDLYKTWTRIRTESQTLLYLRDYQFSIGEELKKLQDMFDEYCSKIDFVKTSIALLIDNLNLAKQGKVRCMASFERKERDKEIEMDSIKNEIKLLTNPCFVDSDSVRKRLELLAANKASLEKKTRSEGNKLASFESKIKDCEEQLRMKTVKLKTVEQKVSVAGETLKLMKDARRCCEEAIPMFELVFVHRLQKLNGCYVKFYETADVGIIKRIYLLKHRFGGGFNLDFGVPTQDLCAEISKILAIDVKRDIIYKLAIDNQGGHCMCHILQLA